MSAPREDDRTEGMENRLMYFIEQQFEHQRLSDKSSKVKKKYAFQYKGNQLQAEFNESILEKLADVKELINSGSQNRSSALVDEIIKDVNKRVKMLRLADRSPGWMGYCKRVPER